MIGFIFHFLFYKGKNPDEMGQMFNINSEIAPEEVEPLKCEENREVEEPDQNH